MASRALDVDPRQFDKAQDAFGRETVGGDTSYGGSTQAARDEAARLRQAGKDWDNAYGANGANGDTWNTIDYRAADAARAQGQESRQHQMFGQAAAQDLESGGGPSAATAQYGMAADAAMQAQASQGGLGAQRAGALQSNAALGNFGAARSGETGAARDTFAVGAGNIRQGDTRQAGQDWDQQQARAKDFYQKRGLTDEMSQFYNQQEYGANAQQLKAEMQQREMARARKIQGKKVWDDRYNTTGADLEKVAGTVATGVTIAGATIAGGAAGFAGSTAAAVPTMGKVWGK